jgi:hypothetical protein
VSSASTCCKCGRNLPRSEFYATPSGRLRKPCRQCRRETQRVYRDAHREGIRRQQRAYSKRPGVRQAINARRSSARARSRYIVLTICGLRFPVHRYVVLMHRGQLRPEEVVHHVDHDPRNNSIKNLIVFTTQGQHKEHEAGLPTAPVWRGEACDCSRCHHRKEDSHDG